MSTMPDFIAQAAEAKPDEAPPADKLDAVRRKAAELRQLYTDHAALAESLANIDRQINLIESRDLLELMSEAKMPSFALDADGNLPPAKFERTQITSAGLPKEREGEAFLWLDEAGHGDLIKNEFKVALGMGDGRQADKLAALLAKNRVEYSRRVSVHPSSLLAFVKKQIAAGEPIPNDLLGVYTAEKVSVSLGGEKMKKGKK